MFVYPVKQVRGRPWHGQQTTQPTRDIETKLFYCWASVTDGGPTIKQHWVNVLGAQEDEKHCSNGYPHYHDEWFYLGYKIILGWYVLITLPLSNDYKDYFVPLYMKGCICHYTKWQIHPFISKGTIYGAQFRVHSTIDSTTHTRRFNSLEHRLLTNTMSNIQSRVIATDNKKRNFTSMLMPQCLPHNIT